MLIITHLHNMKKKSLLLLILFCALNLNSQNKQMSGDEYTSDWLKVAEFEKKSLPQSAAKVVNEILQKAVDNKNSPQVIKAIIHQGKYYLAVDNQNDTTVFFNLKEMLAESNNVVEASVIHSMLGELYLQYYQSDQWNINQRTELGDYVPSDMKEWTKKKFYDKVVEHLHASLAAYDELVNTEVEDYAAVIELGKDSRRYYPTMFDFLSQRAISFFAQISSDEDLNITLRRKGFSEDSLLVPIEQFVELDLNVQTNDYNLFVFETYQRLFSSLLDRNMHKSVLLTELDLLDKISIPNNAYNLKPVLDRLLKRWEKEAISVEVIDKIASSYQFEIVNLQDTDSVKSVEKSRELYELLVGNIKKFPTYERISILENRLSQMTSPQFSVIGNRTYPINGDKEISVTFKNVNTLTAKLYRIHSPLDVQMAQVGVNNNIEKRRSFVKDISVPLPQTPEYTDNNTSLLIDIDTPGTYMLTFESDPEMKGSGKGSDYYFAVSDLAVFSRSSSKHRYEFYVVNRLTGQPKENVEVNIYKLPGNWRNSNLVLEKTINTNNDGLAIYDKTIPNNDVFYNVVSDTDNGSLLTRMPYAFYEFPDKPSEEQDFVTVFTDRSLYRPGQTVYFKAILNRSKDGESSIITDKQLDFTMRDTNNREISKQSLTTNEFGSVSGEFILPQGILSGFFIIESDRGSANFRVEEYKRPTFEVTFYKIDETYKFGEEITLKGKAESFSGIKLQNAVVEWNIKRQQTWWRMWNTSPEHFTNGSVITDENGEFQIKFTPEKKVSTGSIRNIFSFVVEATVTDLNGETQFGSYSVTVGDVSMILQTEMSDRYEKNSDESIVISAKNLDGADIAASGFYQIYSLNDIDSIDQQVAKGEFVTGEQPGIKKELSKLSSGKYRLKLVSVDDRGNDIEAENDFILFSYSDKRPPIKTNEWLVRKSSSFSPEKVGEVILGVSDNVYVLYELWNENNLIEWEWLELTNENKLFAIPYDKEYSNGVTLILTYVKDEKFYSHKTEIRPERAENNLNVRLDVFRDKIRPGSDEEWRISVNDKDGNPVLAEVLASMYDFSLDNIYKSHPWYLSLRSFERYISMREFSNDQSFNRETARDNYFAPMKRVEQFEFDRFNWYGFSLHGRMMLRGGLNENIVVGFGVQKSAEVMSADQAVPSPPSPPSETSSIIVAEEAQSAKDSSDREMHQVRSSFNETAFFYPQLRTNQKGETQIAFTVPESNTRWRFRVFAHDKKLNTGNSEAFTVSQKELMVTPNIPRFLRHDDKTSITAKISNLSDSLQLGEVYFEFINPVTDEIINDILIQDKVQSFSLKPNASTDATWTFDVPDNIDVIGIRIVAHSDRFSDGEQHVLAVLPNKMLVTETIRMDVNGNETKSFSMDRLTQNKSDTREDYRLTLDFTSNPAWYAIQALPVLGEPTSENSVSWFASYYANRLGAHIGNTYPRVSSMVDAWKKQGGDENTFLSNLQKNEELKNVLLEETPWVMQAKNETEQKERLSLLFDLNRSRYLTQTALLRLQDLQTTQGGWSWFKDFRPSINITQYILYGFNQLKVLDEVELSEEIQSMQTKAVAFIDAEAIRRFEALKKYNKDWRNIKSIPSIDLEYLYVRMAYNDHPKDKEVKDMTDFYLSVIKRNWTGFGLYERSLIAILMQKEGETHIVEDILNSYREHSVINEELGMHWPNNRAQVFMSQSAVSVHTFIMEAFLAGGASIEEMNNMKRWLLKQKQVQQWESTHATMDAVYALLSTGSDWFSDEGETLISLGGELVKAENEQIGTGYIKESWSRSEISPEMGNVIVEHKGVTPAWGALYLQYFEDMDKITKTDASLDIEKMLFVEHTDSSGTQLMRVSENSSLNVGDKVVIRLTLRTDRDMEFVHLKDMRAVCFEPTNQLSGMEWQNGVPYYRATKDASTNLYFDNLPSGTYIFEYSVYVNRPGNYSNGITSIQSMYAPEFTSHTEGIRIIVN